MSAGKVMIGLVAGLAAGAVLGVLFAPKKGSTMRRRISQASVNYVDDIKEKFSDFVDNVMGRYEREVEEFEMTEPVEKTAKGKS